MPEVFVEFDEPVRAPDGAAYVARACGAETSDGTDRWEGWVEFVPIGGGQPLRSRRETTQPNRTDTVYWATGLTPVYLRGTLERTLAPPPSASAPQAAGTIFDGPAPPGASPLDPQTPAVLNPFSVYRKSETVLRDQLAALSNWHLANVIRTYELSDLDRGTLERATPRDLVELIVAGVKLRAAG